MAAERRGEVVAVAPRIGAAADASNLRATSCESASHNQTLASSDPHMTYRPSHERLARLRLQRLTPPLYILLIKGQLSAGSMCHSVCGGMNVLSDV